MATTNEAMVWTCELALAVAGQDQAEINRIVDEVTAVPGGPPLLLTTMAGTLAAMTSQTSGPNWRKGLEATIAELKGS